MIRTMKWDRIKEEYVYLLDDKPVTKDAWHAEWSVVPTNFAKGECPKVRGDLDDFSSENGGRGRFNPQINDYMKNPTDALEKGRKKGYRKIG